MECVNSATNKQETDSRHQMKLMHSAMRMVCIILDTTKTTREMY